MNYWSKTLSRRLSRRRAIASMGGGAAGALLLVACGGDDEPGTPGTTTGASSTGVPSTGGANSGSTSTGTASSGSSGGSQASGLLTEPVDTSGEAVPGGIWMTSATAEAQSLDPHTTSSGGAFTFAVPGYDTLLRYDRGTRGQDGPIIGSAAESWEFSPDGLTLTLHLQSNLKYDPRPPTNSRVLDSSDVAFSWERTAEFSPYAPDWVNARNSEAPVLSLETPDPQTVVLNLSYPYLGMTRILAHNTYFHILPKEADGGFDPKSEIRGTGPFRLEKWTPSVSYEWKKNPDWIESDRGRPFLDGFTTTILPEYAAGLAQFEAGNLWTFAVNPEDLLATKKRNPGLVMRQSWEPAPRAAGFGHVIVLSQQPDSPMRDVRVRRAASMLIDRDAWIDATYGTEQFEDAGLPVNKYWNSHIPGYMGEWLDPMGSELGEGAQYFQFNVEEAKKLLSAAGYDGKEVSYFFTDRFGVNENTILQGMLAEQFSTDFQNLDYASTWRDTCQRSLGTGFSGFCYLPVSGFSAENYLQTKYTPEGKAAITGEPIPELTDLVRQIKVETDEQNQVELVKQAQRQAAMIMPDIVLPGFTYGFTLNQPWLENFGVYSGLWLTARLYLDYWYNEAKHS